MSKITTFFKGLKTALKTSWQDYPEALFFSYAVTALLIVQIHNNIDYIFGLPFENVLLSLVTAVPLFLTVASFSHNCAGGRKLRLIGDGIALIIVALLYFSLSPDMTATEAFRLFVYNISFYLLFSLIPFYRNCDKYDIGVIGLIARAAITLLYSIVLILGLFAILATIDNLLGISIDSELYGDITTVILAGFAPTFFLGKVPNRQSVEWVSVDRLIQKLHIYVIVPLLLIYSAILYIYFAKIAFVQQLPQNRIVHLTLWYGLIAILTLFFSYSYREQYALGRFAHKWLARILVLPVGMMLFSLYLRISQYGFTVKRYFVLALALWLAGIVSYFAITQKRKFQYIVVAAILIMVLSLDAPINAFNVSFNSQLNRLTTLLEHNAMLVDGTLLPNAAVAADDKRQICELIDYFNDQEQLSDIEFLPADFNPYDDMQDQFGFEFDYGFGYADREHYISYYFSSDDAIANAEQISEYNQFYLLALGEKAGDGQIWQLDDTDNVVIELPDDRKISVPLAATLQQLKDDQYPNSETILVIEGQAPNYRLLIKELSGYYSLGDDDFTLDYLAGYLFIE